MPRNRQAPRRSGNQYVGLALTLLCIGALVGASVYFSQSKEEDTPNPALPTTTQKAPDSAPVAEEPKPVEPTIEKKTIEEKNVKYEIDVSYPVLKKGDTEMTGINQIMKADAQAAIKDFKDSFFESEKDGSIGTSDTSWLLERKFDTPFKSDDILAVITPIYSYTGGAHPSDAMQTYFIDVKNEKILSLSDIFISDASLAMLSEVVIAELKTRDISEDDWIENGAGPTKENYKSFYLSEKGLTILFPTYQVASYAGGPQEVTIPFSKLKGVVKGEYAGLK